MTDDEPAVKSGAGPARRLEIGELSMEACGEADEDGISLLPLCAIKNSLSRLRTTPPVTVHCVVHA
jgi:hypothetical protein